MKFFCARIDGQEQIIGSATATKRWLKPHPEVASVERHWWSGNDLIARDEFTPDQMLTRSICELNSGETAQWALDHSRFC